MSGRLNIVDHPWAINAVFVVVVVAHAVFTGFEVIPNIWADFMEAIPDHQAAVYLGFVGASAIVSGFAGVIVVFGLSATSVRFREFRVKGGRSLARNWASTSASGLSASALGLAATLLVYSPLLILSPWLLELAILFVLHSGVRLIWLLRGIVDIVRTDDIAYLRDRAKKPLSDVPWLK